MNTEDSINKTNRQLQADDAKNRNYDLPSGLLEYGQPAAADFNQGGIGDCWLISTLKAMADAGYDLRYGIWQGTNDEGKPCYFVTLYDNGKPVQVEVDYVYRNGTQGVAALWEAAIRKQFGTSALKGGYPNWAWEAITGKKPLKVDGDPGDEALKSKGSKPTPHESKTGNKKGTISVASSIQAPLHWPWQQAEEYTGFISAKTNPAVSETQKIRIVYAHAYEVVDAKNGMIALRNPWGYGNSADGNVSDGNDGVFWISESDFDRLFDKDSRQ